MGCIWISVPGVTCHVLWRAAWHVCHVTINLENIRSLMHCCCLTWPVIWSCGLLFHWKETSSNAFWVLKFTYSRIFRIYLCVYCITYQTSHTCTHAVGEASWGEAAALYSGAVQWSVQAVQYRPVSRPPPSEPSRHWVGVTRETWDAAVTWQCWTRRPPPPRRSWRAGWAGTGTSPPSTWRRCHRWHHSTHLHRV